MKIVKLDISGMRNVEHKSYSLSDLTYFSGPNGSGKSTAIDAILLCILGYIPGTPKKGSNIMQNSNGNTMSVSVTFADSLGKLYKLTRQFIKKGNSVSSEVVTDPDGWDYESLVDEVSEIPVYNFNELLTLSSNQQKAFFIKNLLDESDSKLDIMDRIKKELPDNIEECQSDILSELSQLVEEYASNGMSSIEILQNLNEHLKSEQQLKKVQISESESSLRNLVKDESVTADKSEVNKKISEINESIIHQRELLVKKKSWDKWIALVGADMDEIDSIDMDKQITDTDEYAQLMDARKTYTDASSKIRNKQADIDEKISKLRDRKAELSSEVRQKTAVINSGGICQYTNEKCKSIQDMIVRLQADVVSITKKINKIDEDIAEYGNVRSSLSVKLSELNTNLDAAQKKYDSFSSTYQNHLTLKKTKPEEVKVDYDILAKIELLSSELQENQKLLEKISQNEAYDKLYADTYKKNSEYTLQFNMIKELIKITSENGLQTDCVVESFNSFKSEIDDFLKVMFNNDNISAAFNVENKANSFSFGMYVNNKYIPYTSLSSGEKCQYMLAFLSTVIMKQSDNNLKAIIIDDYLDHLDSKAMKSGLAALVKIKEESDIQYILAGVAPCNIPGIKCIKVNK